MSKFTKGPWKVGFSADCEKRSVWRSVERSDGYALATTGRYLRDFAKRYKAPIEIADEESLANANLIAAAPDLYEIVDSLRYGSPVRWKAGSLFGKRVAAALAKADGVK